MRDRMPKERKTFPKHQKRSGWNNRKCAYFFIYVRFFFRLSVFLVSGFCFHLAVFLFPLGGAECVCTLWESRSSIWPRRRSLVLWALCCLRATRLFPRTYCVGPLFCPICSCLTRNLWLENSSPRTSTGDGALEIIVGKKEKAGKHRKSTKSMPSRKWMGNVARNGKRESLPKTAAVITALGFHCLLIYWLEKSLGFLSRSPLESSVARIGSCDYKSAHERRRVRFFHQIDSNREVRSSRA